VTGQQSFFPQELVSASDRLAVKMDLEHVRLHREQETMLMTLYLHALDARSPHPILGDPFAAELMERIDYDFSRLARLAGNLPVILSRAKAVDVQVKSYLCTHTDAVVVHLGCGLDTRVLRIDPGPGVTWFDVDQEPVIDIRRRLVADRAGVAMLAASATERRWWSAVPTKRPTLVVGEGLLMYLPPTGIATLIDAALTRPDVPTHTLVFDTVAPWVRRISGWQPNFRDADTKFASTTDDLDAAIDRRNDVTLVDEQSIVALARRSTSGALGAVIGAVNHFRAGHRAMVLRTYRHQPAADVTPAAESTPRPKR
jgi:O-methyltransferase